MDSTMQRSTPTVRVRKKNWTPKPTAGCKSRYLSTPVCLVGDGMLQLSRMPTVLSWAGPWILL